VLVWGRSPDKAAQTAQVLCGAGLQAQPVAVLSQALAQADIVSCATLASEPLVLGDAVTPGTHVDLVGAFTPTMREADARLFERAAAVWCDTREGALREAGDIVQAIGEGRFAAERIAGDLATLCRGAPPARSPDGITVFKSVGVALEDLVAARLVVDALG
jgi:ornithine cyclodeaminase